MNRDITISELPATTVADDNSYIPIDNGDITYRIKVSDYNAGANVTARAYAEAAGTHASAAAESASSAAEASELCLRRVEMTESNVRTASDKANEAQTYANTAYEYAAAASTSASNATSQAQQVSDYAREAGEKSEDAEAYAVGQRKGVDVTSEDETFENNAKYYKEQASAEVARISDLTANVSSNALKAEGYAVGTQNGSPILSEYSQNNAKYYAENAASSAHIARVSKDTAVMYANKAESAVVKAPYIGDNNHWYVYDFSQEEYVDTTVNATGNPGTPGQKGDTGITPTITATASVDNTSGTPSVTVQKTGTNTNPSFAFNFRGLKGQPGDGSGTSYDDTEIKSEINDIWKVQGELGAKNLLDHNYADGDSKTNHAIVYTKNRDGSITMNGTSDNYSKYFLKMNDTSFLKSGHYKLYCKELIDGVSVEIGNGNFSAIEVITHAKKSVSFDISEDNTPLTLRIWVLPGVALDNLTLRVMVCYGVNQDDTYQQYAKTNKELTDDVENLKSFAYLKPYDGITCWGDSLTTDSAYSWSTRLGELSGLNIYNAGTGGEDAQTIMARQGGDIMIINNVTIPATTTPVILGYTSSGGIDTELGRKADISVGIGITHTNPVLIKGIEGDLRKTSAGTWTFTRRAEGEEIIIDRPTAIRTNFDRNHNSYNDIMIIFMGSNGWGSNDVNELVNMHKLMVDHFKGKEYVVLGFSKGSTVENADYESAMVEAFGRRFISLRQYLAHPIYENGEIVSCYGLADQGLEPGTKTYNGVTYNALEEIAQGIVPHQILEDTIHFTRDTKIVIGNMLYKKMQELNIL